MGKISKILFMLALILMLVFGYTSITNAATEVDVTGYEEVAEELEDDSEKKDEPETPKPVEETKKDLPNKSTEAHVQAGSFETTAIITTGAILLIVAGIGYVKYKKYNF